MLAKYSWASIPVDSGARTLPPKNGEMTLTSMFTQNLCLLCVLFVRIILWSKAIVVLPNAAMSEVFDTRRYLSSEPRILSEAKCRRYWKYKLSSGPPYARLYFVYAYARAGQQYGLDSNVPFPDQWCFCVNSKWSIIASLLQPWQAVIDSRPVWFSCGDQHPTT